MRLFTAVDPPDSVREQCAALQAPNKLDARWTSPEQFHVTIRFIGDADEEQAGAYKEALARMDAPSVMCRPYGLDVLPSRRNPRVLIVGLKRTDTLMALYKTVSNALEEEGLAPEDRTYRPHITLARMDDASPETVHGFLNFHTAPSVDSFRVDTLSLYESILTKQGAVHEQRAAVSLGR